MSKFIELTQILPVVEDKKTRKISIKAEDIICFYEEKKSCSIFIRGVAKDLDFVETYQEVKELIRNI
jgi:hypothetical protein